jgi:hypothetical protein
VERKKTFTWSGSRGVAGYTEAQACAWYVSFPTSSSHVGTTRKSLEAMPAGSGDVAETVPSPPALPDSGESHANK